MDKLKDISVTHYSYRRIRSLHRLSHLQNRSRESKGLFTQMVGVRWNNFGRTEGLFAARVIGEWFGPRLWSFRRIATASVENLTLDTRFRGRLSTLSGYSGRPRRNSNRRDPDLWYRIRRAGVTERMLW
jgi:hypothetical protein